MYSYLTWSNTYYVFCKISFHKTTKGDINVMCDFAHAYNNYNLVWELSLHNYNFFECHAIWCRCKQIMALEQHKSGFNNINSIRCAVTYYSWITNILLSSYHHFFSPKLLFVSVKVIQNLYMNVYPFMYRSRTRHSGKNHILMVAYN